MSAKIIRIVMGFPGSGKSRFVKKFVELGYKRLNRDEKGGSLDDLVKDLEKLYKQDNIEKFCLDNTYITKKSRATVLSWAKNNDFTVECYWLTTDVANAQYNVAKRMIASYGKLLMPEEIKLKTKEDPGVYSPAPIFRARKQLEKPTLEEGFAKIEKIPFKRELDYSIYKNKGIILDYDGTLRKTKSGEKYPKIVEDIEILPNRTETLKEYQRKGFILLGVSNQSGVAKGELTLETADNFFKHTNKLLGLDIDYKFCPHGFFPQVCYCRKPIPGLGVEFIEKYKLNPAQCIMVGDRTTDKTFASRCGFKFVKADEFFK
jgi:histidinol-phosphate phosphatase family protein